MAIVKACSSAADQNLLIDICESGNKRKSMKASQVTRDLWSSQDDFIKDEVVLNLLVIVKNILVEILDPGLGLVFMKNNYKLRHQAMSSKKIEVLVFDIGQIKNFYIQTWQKSKKWPANEQQNYFPNIQQLKTFVNFQGISSNDKNKGILNISPYIIIKMSKIQCFGCLNSHSELLKENTQEKEGQNGQLQAKVEKAATKVTFNIETEENNEDELQNSIYFNCECCENTYCLACCGLHIKSSLSKLQKQSNLISMQSEKNEKIPQGQTQNTQNPKTKISIICQQCQSASSDKYCESCEQFLCQKCSFKIHNKGKRAKHKLDDNIAQYILKSSVLFINKEIINYLRQQFGQDKKLEQSLRQFISDSLKMAPEEIILLVEQGLQKETQELNQEMFAIKTFNPEELKYNDLMTYRNQFPFLQTCKIVIISNETPFHKALAEAYDNIPVKLLKIEIIEQFKKKFTRNHERVNSEKIEVKHNKNISNFSNLSAISKVQNQSVLSNEPSDLFESNELSLNITLNQNSSILMMGALSDREKQQKQQKKQQTKEKQAEKLSNFGHHRIYSIRQENSHNQANNMSTSTQNSIRKRNKKWPIPYFQPFRIPKYLGGVKYSGQLYLRQLAEKGILMIRREKADQSILDPDISRSFVRNIGQKQIEYIAYIIDFLSVECLAWVIESIKEDMMTPSEKLIQSRLKESFDLKINIKLWDSIIKYLQSPQYDQDYFQNTKSRYVPKISVVKYGEEFLLEFQERKWAYEDQQLLDEEQQEWKQFKKLITDYFNGKSQITGGRYGCVQYVKLNGPKPLRKCSLGKISMYVQEAINKGIIRYHKTLLVSNSENNTSMCSNANGIITNVQQLAQFQRDIKIMGLQVGLIDMFLENPPNTPISMAQIPLNLKAKVLFDYNLVDLGFPKLKNLLNTLNDKLILQSTKTHTTYETTTNGSEAIQKLRAKLAETSQNFLIHILTYINQIITLYQNITLQDLYNQLTIKLGFPFDFKIYNVPDFYQFALYFCSQVINVQFISGIFVAYTKYPTIPYETYQTHRTTYSQEQYPSYGNHYQVLPNEDYSKTTEKKQTNQQNKYVPIKIPTRGGSELDPFGYSASVTPKFNYEKKNEFNAWDECYENSLKKEEKNNEDYAFDDKLLEQNIINILDDGDKSASHPKTVIVNDGSQFNNPNQFCLSKDQLNGDQYDNFYDGGVWGDQITQEAQLNKYGKIQQHLRVKSTSQPAVKHNRVYSTIETRKQ